MEPKRRKTKGRFAPGAKPTVYFVVCSQAEVLDFSGPFDVFSMARVATETDLYDMKLVSADGQQVCALHGFKVVPDLALADAKPAPTDIVFVPGGSTALVNAIAGPTSFPPPPGDFPCDHALQDECTQICDWLAGPAQQAGAICTVCIGAFFGARAGLFGGGKSTTHHGQLELLGAWIGHASRLEPQERANIVHGARYVCQDKAPAEGRPLVLASAGVSAGMDLAFAVLSKVWSVDTAAQTAALMEYNGTTDFAANATLAALPLPTPLQWGSTAPPSPAAKGCVPLVMSRMELAALEARCEAQAMLQVTRMYPLSPGDRHEHEGGHRSDSE